MTGYGPKVYPPITSTGVDNPGVAVNVTIVRVPYPTANTEQFIVLPDGTSKIYAAAENLDTRMRFSYTLGGTGGSPGSYVTVHRGNSYYREGLELSSKTLYYRADKGGIMIEFEIWV